MTPIATEADLDELQRKEEAAKAALLAHVEELKRQLYRTEESSANQYERANRLENELEHYKHLYDSSEKVAMETVATAHELRAENEKLRQEIESLRDREAM